MLTNGSEKGDISEKISRSHTDTLLEIGFHATIWVSVCSPDTKILSSSSIRATHMLQEQEEWRGGFSAECRQWDIGMLSMKNLSTNSKSPGVGDDWHGQHSLGNTLQKVNAWDAARHSKRRQIAAAIAVCEIFLRKPDGWEMNSESPKSCSHKPSPGQPLCSPHSHWMCMLKDGLKCFALTMCFHPLCMDKLSWTVFGAV